MSLLRLTFKFVELVTESKDDNVENNDDESKMIELKTDKGNDNDNENEENVKREVMIFDGRHPKLIIQETYKLDSSQYDMSDDFYEIDQGDFDLILKGIRNTARGRSNNNNNNRNNRNNNNESKNNDDDDDINEIKMNSNSRGYVSSSKRMSDYNVTCIRVRLPQSIDSNLNLNLNSNQKSDENENENENKKGSFKQYLQAYFKTDETVGDVRRFVLEMMTKESLHSRIDILLYIAPPKQMLNDDYVTLKSIGLVPAAIINLKFRFQKDAPKFKLDQNKFIIERIGNKSKATKENNNNNEQKNDSANVNDADTTMTSADNDENNTSFESNAKDVAMG